MFLKSFGGQISFKEVFFTKKTRKYWHQKKVRWVSECCIFVFKLTVRVHLLSLIGPIFTYVDPYSAYRYRSGSTKFLNTDPIWIRIHNTVKFQCSVRQEKQSKPRRKLKCFFFTYIYIYGKV